jgi:hypothetical protein
MQAPFELFGEVQLCLQVCVSASSRDARVLLAANACRVPAPPCVCLQPDDGGGAALPVDVVLAASPCQQSVTPGITTAVAFDVTAPYNPEYLKGLTIQVTFASVLWPTVVLTCQNAAAQREQRGPLVSLLALDNLLGHSQ